MNKLTIIGNITKDPELRTTPSKKSVCTFDVAVNSRRGGEEVTDYFRVAAWQALGENCAKYLEKGKKVCVVGRVHLHNGKHYADMEVTAEDVEFLSPKSETKTDSQTGMEVVTPDDMPY